MQTLPQEIVDKIIDELVALDVWRTYYDVPYLLISRAWVMRIQKYLFERIRFNGVTRDLEKWSRKIAPDPAGVSHHTRELAFANINTLEGFEAHTRAFTRLEYVKITLCNFLLSPSHSIAECLAPTSSSLTRLMIHLAETTLRVITSLLIGLPQLKIFIAMCLKVTDTTDGTNLVPRIPFLEGNNSLVLRTEWEQTGPPGPPD